eukprot:TRINITY_DN1792_c0_g1_i1.p1 TRINITY_DN1792_c0_g1~~TRINITY_DN1792_c0_g1_i1.p1  ORF type:complete len:317 (+),score=93.35 TRINITY_DN1792_c0_g1_i1:158-1108(+)
MGAGKTIFITVVIPILLYTVYFLITSPFSPFSSTLMLSSTPSYSSLRSHYTFVVNTPRGSIEYLTLGKGPTLLLLHSSPGGLDQSLALLLSLFPSPSQSGFQFLLVSRPGYGNSTLHPHLNSSPLLQAEWCISLLDELEVDKVGVISLGGFGSLVGDQIIRKFERRVWIWIDILDQDDYDSGHSDSSLFAGSATMKYWGISSIWDFIFGHEVLFGPLLKVLIGEKEGEEKWNLVVGWVKGIVGHVGEIGYANDEKWNEGWREARERRRGEAGRGMLGAGGRRELQRIVVDKGVLDVLRRKKEIVSSLEKSSEFLVW